MPRKAHGHKPEKDPRQEFAKDVVELGRRFEEAIGAAVTRPEFREGMESLTTSLRGAAMKIVEAANAARQSPEGEAFARQAEKVAKSGQAAGTDSAALLARQLAAGLKTLAAELEGFAGRTKKGK